jgi:processing peptidase subunit beta
MGTQSNLAEESLENERSVILREMKEIEKNLEETIFDHLHATAYRGSSLSRTILGPKENILSITRQDILNYIQTHYTADRIVIAASGAIEHNQIVKLAEELFGKVPSTPAKKVIKEPAAFVGSDRLISYESWEKAHIALAYPVGGWNDADTYPLMVAQQLLGSWDKETAGTSGSHSASPLIREIAKENMAYSVSTFNTQYSDTSLFGVYLVAHPVGLQKLLYHVLKCITRLSYEVDEIQLESAKNQIKYQILASLDGSTSIAEDIGRQLLSYGRRIHPAEQIARIDAVDVNAVKLAARRFFYDRDHALAAIGNLHELPDYVDRRRRSYWIRF